MWPALVVGILTAIFAWIWYRGGEEAKDPETPEELAVGSEPGHLASRERSLPPGDPDGDNTTGEEEVTRLGFQKNKAGNPETCQAKNEQKSHLQGKDPDGRAVVDHLESGLEVQRPATTNGPTLADQRSNGPAPELPGNIQEHLSDVPKEDEEHPSDHPKKESLQADIGGPPTDVLKEHPTDLPIKEVPQADIGGHPTDVLKEHPTDLPIKEVPQADIGVLPTDVLKEHPTNIPIKEVPQADIGPPPTDVLKEHPTDLPIKEVPQADIGGPLTDVLNAHPTDLPIKEVLQADIQERPTEALMIAKLQVEIQECPIDVQKKGVLQADIQEHPTDALRVEKLQADLQECPIEAQEKEVLQADPQEHPTDVPAKEELQAHTEVQSSHVPKKDELAVLLERQTVFQGEGDHLLEGHAKDTVQTCANEISSKKDEICSHEVGVHPSEIPEAEQIFIFKAECNSLMKEMQPSVGHLDPVEQAAGEETCPPVMAEEPGAQTLPADSWPECMSVQGEEFVHPENGHHDGVCATSELNGEDQAAIDATGYPLGNEFIVKESALNLYLAKETLNKDLYLEMGNTSNDNRNADIDQYMKQSMEKCDIVKHSTDFLDDADLHDGNLNESLQEGSAKVQKLETHPDGSSVDIYNLGFTLEKQMVGLGSSNTDDKTSFGSPSEANIHENDHQKTRKVATVQPMPQNVNFVFKVHYITQNGSQIIAITGDHEKLGKWKAYVPLTSKNGGFWSDTIILPADAILAWKFVMVESGKIKRWEECNNRVLKTAHEDIEAQLWWGYP